MTTQRFKELIKEAIREELPLILMEYQQRTPTKFNQPQPQSNENLLEVRNNLKNKMASLFDDIPKSSSIPTSPMAPEPTGNPYLSLLQETAQNMSAQDVAGIRNLG